VAIALQAVSSLFQFPRPGLAGLDYRTLVWPPLANSVSPFNLALAAPGELSLVLWLLAIGVNVERWKEQAAR